MFNKKIKRNYIIKIFNYCAFYDKSRLIKFKEFRKIKDKLFIPSPLTVTICNKSYKMSSP